MYVGRVTGIFRLPLALQSCQSSSARSWISRLLAIPTNGIVAIKSQQHTVRHIAPLNKPSAKKDDKYWERGLFNRKSSASKIVCSQHVFSNDHFRRLKSLKDALQLALPLVKLGLLALCREGEHAVVPPIEAQGDHTEQVPLILIRLPDLKFAHVLSKQ